MMVAARVRRSGLRFLITTLFACLIAAPAVAGMLDGYVDAEDGKLGLTVGVEEHLYHCLDCRACNTVCPPGVRQSASMAE